MRRSGLTVLGIALILAGCAGSEDVGSNKTNDQRELLRCSAKKLTQAEMLATRAKLQRLAPEDVDRQPASNPVPVWVHWTTNGTTGDFTDAQIEAQIEALNRDFGGEDRNADEPPFDSSNPKDKPPHNSAYRFVLKGIDRTDLAAWYTAEPGSPEQAEMKRALHKGGRGDLNLYFNAPNSGALGSSTYPWNLDVEPRPDSLLLDGVVLHNAALPGGTAPYNEGNNATHEIGHWLGLVDTFYGGCSGTEDGATMGDWVKDTGRQAAPTYDCPLRFSRDTCPGMGNLPDPTQNFMDFTEDKCMFAFTREQALRMNRNWKAYRTVVVTETCGNGVLDDGEACDTAITSGHGKCPTLADCDDGKDCTKDEVIGQACQQECFNGAITEPDDGSDNCCPASGSDDPNCEPEELCGNGKVDDGESCDIAITSGAGKCPTVADCADTDSCTTDSVSQAGTCKAVCEHTDKGPVNGDGCCPEHENHNTDSDCVAVCGNGVVEAGEECDPPGATCDEHCQNIEAPKPARAFRLDAMYLRDPHIYLKFGGGCIDVTDVPPIGDELAVNLMLNKQLSTDTNPVDGNYDLSPVCYMNPLDQGPGVTSPTTMDLKAGCKIDGSGCTASDSKYAGESTAKASGLCVGKLPGTTWADYETGDLSINQPTNQCFATKPQSIAIELQGVKLTLSNAVIGAKFDGDPATGLSTGLIRGFLSEADAKAISIDIPFVGTKKVSELLPGGEGSCAAHSDIDVVDGVRGWWFYVNFTALQASYPL